MLKGNNSISVAEFKMFPCLHFLFFHLIFLNISLSLYSIQFNSVSDHNYNTTGHLN